MRSRSVWCCFLVGLLDTTSDGAIKHYIPTKLEHSVEDASPEVLKSMEDAANIHDEEC